MIKSLSTADPQEHAVEGGVSAASGSASTRPLVHAVPQVRRYVLSFILDPFSLLDVPTQAMNVDAVAELRVDELRFRQGRSRFAA